MWNAVFEYFQNILFCYRTAVEQQGSQDLHEMQFSFPHNVKPWNIGANVSLQRIYPEIGYNIRLNIGY